VSSAAAEVLIQLGVPSDEVARVLADMLKRPIGAVASAMVALERVPDDVIAAIKEQLTAATCLEIL